MHLSAPIRVLIADDLPELRTLLRTTLQGRGFQLVGEAADGHEALRLAADTEPDVVVLDLGMPGTDGPAMVAELRRRVPATRVVALSAFTAEEVAREALDRGAHACLDRDVDPDRLVATLREVCGRAFGPLALPPPGGLEGRPEQRSQLRDVVGDQDTDGCGGMHEGAMLTLGAARTNRPDEYSWLSPGRGTVVLAGGRGGPPSYVT